MMKLSIMLKVDSSINSEWQSPIADSILERWEHDSGSARFFRSSGNFVFTFLKGGERHFLRFAQSTERIGSAILAEMALLNFLASQGLDVAQPVVSLQGNSMETIETDVGTFCAVVFAQLPGRELEIEELNLEQLEMWGAALGRLHAITHRYQGPELAARATWKDHLAQMKVDLSDDKPEVVAEFDALSTFLNTLPISETNYGLIHGDFELDNLRWHEERIAMFDFDDCAFYWYIVDIAFALRDLFPTDVDLNHSSLQAFIRGYRTYYYLADEQIAQFPMFMRLVNLITYTKLVRAIDLTPQENYPEWCNALLLKLTSRREDYKASLHALSS